MPPKKTLAQLGRVEGEGISFQAHIQYRDEQDKRNKHIRGPTRNSRRRAERDLLSIRKASEGHSVWAEAIAAIYAKSRELSQEAEFEANVALGLAQYGFVRDAHKVVDSLPYRPQANWVLLQLVPIASLRASSTSRIQLRNLLLALLGERSVERRLI